MNHIPMWTLAAAGVLTSLPAAAADDDLKALRAEIVQMKQSYEQRIAALERRLSQAEQVAHAAGGPADEHADDSHAADDGSDPEIGLVLQGRLRKAKDTGERAVAGYWPAGHDHEGGKRGFSLQHAELRLAGDVGTKFRGMARFAVSDAGEVEVEEASFTTLGLGGGLTLRGGRFASGIGYQNAQHPHEWDFAEASLMQAALFGAEGYRQDGLQLQWTAPTASLLAFGAELGRGAAFPGTDRNRNGAGAVALFARVGGPRGDVSAWQAGLSYLGTRAEGREAHFEDTDPLGPNEVAGAFFGRSRTLIADFVWQWAPQGDGQTGGVRFQAEVFRRSESGTLGCASDVATSPCLGGASLGALDTRQTGGYWQAVYQFMPQWRVGYRHDWLSPGRKSYDPAVVFAVLDRDGSYFGGHKPRRYSAMIDWGDPESSRLRLQFARDRSMSGVTDHQWTLQYIMHLGSHAH
ncbi:MAG: TonB-dependent receptor [Rhodocyclaceae bacterium]|jgi:hypothetical protein|nr:TonB-dependent receptor [Rhodocyclaceae bacterium]